MLEITNAYRESGSGCNHIALEMDLDGTVVGQTVEFDKLVVSYSELPGGHKGLLLALMAAYEFENGTPIERLFKVRVK